MRDSEGRPVLHQTGDRLLNLLLCFRVHAGGRLVQNKDFWIVQNRARNRDTLPLAAGKPLPPLADLRVVAVGELQQKLVTVGGFGRAHDLVHRGVGLGVSDVVADRAGKEIRFLQDDAELPAKILPLDVANVHAIDQDASVGHIVEAGEQVDDRGFARAAVSDQTDHLARFHVEGEVVQNAFGACRR